MQWLVTGCSTGLGLDIARSALKSGQKCIATSRNPSKSPDAVKEIESLGGVWENLDVTSKTLEHDLEKIVKKHGQVNVLVNNAGYADGDVVEKTDMNAARVLFETNFWGVLRAIQTVLPHMREKKAGTIVNISTSGFWTPPPACGMYVASKFAIEGLSETLAIEVSAFNIRVLVIEPGPMKTAFFTADNLKISYLHEGYKGTAAEAAFQMFRDFEAKASQDPLKTAKAIVKEVLEPGENPPVAKMALGKDSLAGLRTRVAQLSKIADQVEEIASGCDF